MHDKDTNSWTKEDDEKLEGHLLASNSVEKIAEMMNRDADAVLNRCYDLNLIPRFPHP